VDKTALAKVKQDYTSIEGVGYRAQGIGEKTKHSGILVHDINDEVLGGEVPLGIVKMK
jgi:hypothetical protein